tara:strand:- start:6 stop:539 length:534 start_codon:yes stop_codon:yes gene_type:complete
MNKGINKKRGKNKYGIKLEDYSDYEAYSRACKNAHARTARGKLAKKNYSKTLKGKLAKNKYIKGLKCKLTTSIYLDKYKLTFNGSRVLRSIAAKRRAAKLQRTPAWADLEAIKQFYLNCPKGYHVDHDVPLQGVNVSGLHVLNNLVYLTAEDNLKKSNKWPHNYSAQNGFSSNLAIV